MTGKEQEYKEIGFMCGLEIHQRLGTAEKLFCSCTASLPGPEERGGAVVRRYQKAVAGELGIVDRAAKFEEEKKREFIYRINGQHACLVDLDEEPPHGMNREALSIALSIAESLHMTLPQEIQPMRKQVVDGSNPSGFQRTTKIGMNGSLEANGHKINILSMFLEEESAGIEAGGSAETIYDTSRIGIPLIEIDTDPYLASPKEAKEVALKLGTILRLTGKVQRGIGSIRQDVNVSIKGGARVEIKGLQDLDSLDKYIENEVMRQQKLIEIKKELGARKDVRIGEVKDLTATLKGTKVKIINNALSQGGVAIGFALHGFKGIVGREINPDRRLGSEISDYAKTGGVNGIIHSDENLDGYGFAAEEKEAIGKGLKTGKEDAFILIAGKANAASTAAKFAIARAKAAIEVGVQLETRGTINNNLFTTRFLRPLPGGSRMYPETDASPIGITADMLKEAEANSPDMEKTRSRLKNEVKSDLIVEQLLVSPRLQLYNEITSASKADKAFVANTLLQKFTELRRSNFNADAISSRRLIEVFDTYESGKITKNAVEELLKSLSSKDAQVAMLIKQHDLAKLAGSALKKLVDETTKTSGNINKAEVIRLIMSKHRLNVDGEELNEMLK